MPDSSAAADAAPWYQLLATGVDGEIEAACEIEGRLPEGLRGTLYRNGPGLFERAGHRKQHLLDGDGLMQAFRVDARGVRYRRRFVRTPKFLAEQAAGRFRFPTWTTRAPDWWRNVLRPPTTSQAGVSTLWHAGKLLALDEVETPFAIDADTLETLGRWPVAPFSPPRHLKAHTRTDGLSGELLLLGWRPGPRNALDLIVRDAGGRVISRRRAPALRVNYFHDFLATPRHVVVILHPVYFSPLRMLLGRAAYTDCLTWRPRDGKLVLLIPRDPSAPMRVLEAPARFVWHGYNAWESGDRLVCDFIGFREPDHFLGPDPAVRALPRGREGQALHPGEVCRYVIDLARGSLREDVLDDSNGEFPAINPRRQCHAHRYGWSACGPRGRALLDGLRQLDFTTGARRELRLGDGTYVGEPVFAADPADSREDAGWLLSLVLDRARRRSYLGVFDARDLERGPLARAWLPDHSPLSFHGCWVPA